MAPGNVWIRGAHIVRKRARNQRTLSRAVIESNAQISRLRTRVENYFGRLKQLYAITITESMKRLKGLTNRRELVRTCAPCVLLRPRAVQLESVQPATASNPWKATNCDRQGSSARANELSSTFNFKFLLMSLPPRLPKDMHWRRTSCARGCSPLRRSQVR